PAPPAAAGNTPLANVPAQLIPTFDHAAQLTGVPREVLMAIGRVESGFDPRAIGPLIEQYAGTENDHALGMMQFLPSTYRGFVSRVDQATGKNLGEDGVWDADSAIYAAAFYLHESGAPDNLHDAIYAYNHDEDYVSLVLEWAARYAEGVT